MANENASLVSNNRKTEFQQTDNKSVYANFLEKLVDLLYTKFSYPYGFL